MKKFRLFPLILVFCLILAGLSPSAFALDDPKLNGKAAILVDLNTGEIIYEMNKDEPRAPASLTKIMTVLLALEAVERGQCSLDDIVTAQADCRDGMAEDSSTAGIMPGMQTSLRDLLYCAMIHSANESCNVIASHISGNVSAFVQLMNQRAQELGCTNTNFVNTNGLPADGISSSAYDLYLITMEAMKHPLFMEMANTVAYTSENPQINNGGLMNNSNALISPNSYYSIDGRYLYDGASGVKTGYTNAAGYCLISTAKRNGLDLLAVVMGCDGELNSDSEDFWHFVDSRTLYDWAFNNFSYRTILSATEPITKVSVELAEDGGSAVLRPLEDLTVLIPNDVTELDIQRQVTVYDQQLRAPIAAGTVLGEISLLSPEGELYGTVKLINSADIQLSKAEYIRQQIQAVFSKGWVIAIICLILLFVVIYLALVLRYRRLRRKHLMERRRAEQRRRAERERIFAQEQQTHSQSRSPRSYSSEDPSARYNRSADLDIFDEDYFR